MITSMHRLQISLPEWQVRFLEERARRQGASMAEVIRQLIQHEVEASTADVSVNSIWEIVGISEDHGPLLGGIPISEQPEAYLAALALASMSDKTDQSDTCVSS
jgi:hypothetical protein